MLAVALEDPVVGSQSSALDKEPPPVPIPPVIKTNPLFSSVEVCGSRAVVILPKQAKPSGTMTFKVVEPVTDPDVAEIVVRPPQPVFAAVATFAPMVATPLTDEVQIAVAVRSCVVESLL